MVSQMHLVFLILLVTIILFLIPRFRSDLVALASLLALQLTGILSAAEAFAGFANSVVIMIAALFIVGEGVFQTGLAQKAGNMLVKFTGNSELRLTLLMMVLVAVLSGFMSNTGTVAILLPVVVSLSRQMQLHPGKLLMPLAFASSMGGALTLIGTAPNLIASQILTDSGYRGFSFFSFTPIGLLILLVGIAYLWFFGRRWLDKEVEQEGESNQTYSVENLLDHYQAAQYLYYIKVPLGNNSIGKNLKELEWPKKYNITLLEVLKKTGERAIAGPNYEVEVEDLLIIYTDKPSLDRFIIESQMKVREIVSNSDYSLEASNLAEVILTPRSQLINHSLQETHFREKYGLTVLAIKPQYKEPRRPSAEDRLRYGDSFLVHGKWKEINLLSKERSNLVILRHALEPPLQPKNPYRATLAGLILVFMMLMLVLELIPAVVTVVIAAMLMILTGSVRQTDQAYRAINWQTVVLIASMLPMATALEKTGGVAFMSEGLITSLGKLGPLAVLAGLYLTGSAFSQFISNTATAVLLYPVAILTAQQLGVNPEPMVMAVAFSASMAFATPVATPPNAMVMAAGKYTFLDFVKVGLPLQLLIALIAVMVIPLFFPF